MPIEPILNAIRSGYALYLHNDCTTVCRVSPTVLGGCVRVVYSGVKGSAFLSCPSPSFQELLEPANLQRAGRFFEEIFTGVDLESEGFPQDSADVSRNIGQSHGRLVNCSGLIHSDRSTRARE